MTHALAMNLGLAACALIIERLAGYPSALYRWIGHPVTWIGAGIGWLDRHLNRDSDPAVVRRFAGLVALGVILLVTGLASVAIAEIAPGSVLNLLIQALLASSLLAQRSLYTHVRAVETGLGQSLANGRAAVSRIVGRDPDSLDEAGVARAAIESLSENFSDGVVAPAFWLACLGLPGIVLYKTINTADSMIGHLSARHGAFGWAAARLDDLVNLPASRLSAFLILLGGRLREKAAFGKALRIIWRAAPRHRSPNAGWPEGAMAAVLDLRLAGPRSYRGAIVSDAWMGEGTSAACADDIRRALDVFKSADYLLIGLTLLAALLAQF